MWKVSIRVVSWAIAGGSLVIGMGFLAGFQSGQFEALGFYLAVFGGIVTATLLALRITR